MTLPFNDENNYLFLEGDVPELCFLCKENCERTIVVRQISSMKLVHLCPQCMLDNLNDYLLDNTRPWLRGKK